MASVWFVKDRDGYFLHPPFEGEYEWRKSLDGARPYDSLEDLESFHWVKNGCTAVEFVERESTNVQP